MTTGGSRDVEHLAVEWLHRRVPLREKTDADHVRRLAAVLERCPPVVVTTSGGLVDGEHRVEAARSRGWTHIAAVRVDCPDEQVLALALELNTTASLPLSRSERRAAVKVQLELHPGWSDRRTAALCGVSPATAKAVRGEVSGAQSGQVKRTGADGKSYPAAGPGRRRMADAYVRLHPTATIRELREVTGASVGSVSSWRRATLDTLEAETPWGPAAGGSSGPLA